MPPAAVCARAISCGILGDVVAGALVQAMPDRSLALSGPHSLTTLAGIDPDTGRPFVDCEAVAGTLGARPYHDGTDAERIHASGAANLPVESLGLAYPLQVERYELVEDGGGPGTFCGGLPVRRDTRILAQDATLSTSADRQMRPAASLDGGLPGSRGEFVLNPDTAIEQTIPTVTAGMPVRPGNLFSVRTPGGGGYCDPLKREPRLVLGDLLDERISAKAAEEVYGVVVRDGQLDLPATGRLRQNLQQSNANAN